MSLASLLTLPLRKAKMWRTGRGFGIHSPFAFGFVCDVLRNPHPFYAFRSEVTTGADQRLFRVVNHFNPRTVALIGNETAGARRVIALCCPAVRFSNNPAEADFVYLAPGANVPEEFRVLYAADLPEPPSKAMTFSNGRVCIAVRRPSLPEQPFLLNF